MKALSFLLMFSTLAFGFSKSTPSAGPVVGKPAPSFSVKDSNGKKVNLNDYKGKTVVLEWLNHGCPYVQKHYGAKNMQALQSELTKDGAVWLSVVSSAKGKQGQMSPKETNAKAKNVKSKASAILLDTDGKVGKSYGAKTTPHMFVIDKKGLLAYKGAIDSIRSTDAADIPKATNYVRTAYAALKKGAKVEPSATEPYGCSVKY